MDGSWVSSVPTAKWILSAFGVSTAGDLNFPHFEVLVLGARLADAHHVPWFAHVDFEMFVGGRLTGDLLELGLDSRKLWVCLWCFCLF